MAGGSGLFTAAVAKQQTTWGGTFMSTGQRTLIPKSIKPDINPNAVQGGTYLQGGVLGALGSAYVTTWQSNKFTIEGDVLDTACALLILSAFATSSTLTQIGTTSAYGIGGAAGFSLGSLAANNTFFDLQYTEPEAGSGQTVRSLHSCAIQKAQFVFERGALVSYSMDGVAQQSETTTGVLSPTEITTPQPFSMVPAHQPATLADSCVAYGTAGSETVVNDGIRKATFTLERSLARTGADGMYLGNSFIASPVENDYVKATWELDVDYTPTLASGLYPAFLTGATLGSFLAKSVGNIVTGTTARTFMINTLDTRVTAGATPTPDGPKLLSNTITLEGRVDASNDPLVKGIYITPDTGL